MDILLKPFRSPAVIDDVRCKVLLDEQLTIVYQLTGSMNRVDWPDEDDLDNEDLDALWQGTCFEYFTGAAASDRYHEGNQSPSGNWACFAFSAYRQRAARSNAMAPDAFFLKRSDNEATARLEIPLPSPPFHLGIAVVLKDTDGQLHYYAEKHPQREPDFHRRDLHRFIDVSER